MPKQKRQSCLGMKKETLLDLEDTNIFSSSIGMYFRMQIIIMATLCVPLSPNRFIKHRSKRVGPTNNHLWAFSESKRTFPKARSSSGTQRKPLGGLEKTSASTSPAVLKPSAMQSETVTGKSTERDFPLPPCVHAHAKLSPGNRSKGRLQGDPQNNLLYSVYV